MTTIPKGLSTDDFIQLIIAMSEMADRPSAVEEFAQRLRGWVDLPGQLIPVLRKILELLQIPLAHFGAYLDENDPTHKDEKYSSLRAAWERLQLELIGSAPYATSRGISRDASIALKSVELIDKIEKLISSIPKVTGKRKFSEPDDKNRSKVSKLRNEVSKLRQHATNIEDRMMNALDLLENYSNGLSSTQKVLDTIEQHKDLFGSP